MELEELLEEMEAKMIKKIKYTDTGYSYVECTREDCFNWGGICICDNCNEEIKDTVYLVFILGSALCKKCFDKWEKGSRKYDEDLYLQKQKHIAYYRAHGLEVYDE